MRILALVTGAFGSSGGIAQYNRDFLKACASVDGVQEIVVLPRFASVLNGVTLPENVIQLEPRFDRVTYSMSALRTCLRMGPFDFIYCGHLRMGPLAAALARQFNLPLWLQIYGIDAWSRPTPFARWAAEQAYLVTAISRYTRRRFLSWANVPPQRVRILPVTFRSVFSPGPKPAHVLERYALVGHKVLLTVGRLDRRERYKGHDRVIAVIPKLLALCPEICYIVAGDGDDRARLERLVRDNGIGEVVKFIGKVADADLPDLYRVADVFVMPSTQEGFGIVFLEAAASGLPVVGGNQDGSLDALADGDLGKAIDPLNEKELQEALVQALSQERATNPGVSRFSFDRFAVAVDCLIAGMRNTANVSTDA